MTRSRANQFLVLACALWLGAGALSPAPAREIESAAKQAILIDDSTGTVLFEKNADERMAPASLLKLMTIYMVFERLAEGTLELDETLPVSEKAWRTGGSKMFVRVNTRVTVEDLVRGIVVQSGNDACIVVAEALAGSEAAFAHEMTQRGREIGLRDSVFRNATGWPDPEQHMTARDVARLTTRIIHDFPQYYGYFKEKNFTYNEIRQGNRNPLLYKDVGADGLKTGHTQDSGYGLAASALRKERRLVLVVNGLESVNQRASESGRLLDWGFREFKTYEMFSAGQTVIEADTWLGDSATVPLVLEQDFALTLARKARPAMKATVIYDGPIAAPIGKGAEVGKLVITAPETETVEVPLVAGADVGRLGTFKRLGAALSYLVWGAARR